MADVHSKEAVTNRESLTETDPREKSNSNT